MKKTLLTLGLTVGLLSSVAFVAPAQASTVAQISTVSIDGTQGGATTFEGRKHRQRHSSQGAFLGKEVPAFDRRGRGRDDAPGDDRGRRKGGHGADDAVPHLNVNDSFDVARRGRGRDDAPGDDRGRRRGGHGADDAVRG